jgi:hypothetical protein
MKNRKWESTVEANAMVPVLMQLKADMKAAAQRRRDAVRKWQKDNGMVTN